MWRVYILQCKGGSLYTGSTNNVQRRFAAHKSGKGGKYTRAHRPIKIVYTEKVATRSRAMKREYVIKQLERSQKLVLIESA